ncbi:platelet glycoprotein 4-like [Glandiceps talaboti]
MGRLKLKVKIAIAVIVGCIFCALGLALIPILRIIIHNIVEQKLTLSPTSFLYNAWAHAANSSAKVYLQVWVFDLKNEQEVLDGTEKPYLVEKGPYTYSQKQVKHNITFHDNGTVSYDPVSTYIFIPEMSVGHENDTFTGLNGPLVIIASLLRSMPSIVERLGDILAIIMNDSQLFKTFTVKDLIFGYDDPIFKLIYDLTGTLLVQSPQFGILVGKNNTSYQTMCVFTGVDDISKLNIIDRWNGKSDLNYWTTQYANMINGTDASLNPPFMDEYDPHYVYDSVVCRSLDAEFDQPTSVHGIDCNRFHISKKTLASPEENPDNIGFCTPDANHCLPSGLLNMSNCQHGAPVVLSFPHFLYADPSVILPNMNPQKEEHETILDIHKLTGVTLKAAKRMQFNIHVIPDKFFGQLSKVQEVIFPLIWLNQSYMIGDEDAAKFKSAVEVPLEISEIVQWVILGIGGFILLVVVIFLMRRGVKARRSRTRGLSQSSRDYKDNKENGVDERTPLFKDTENNHNSALLLANVDSALLLANVDSALLLANVDSALLLANVDSALLLANVDSALLLANVDSALLLANVDSALLLANVDSALLLANVDSALLLAKVDSALLLANIDSALLLANVDSALLLANVDSALLLANVDSALLLANVDSALLLANVDSALLLANVDSVLLLANVDSALLLANVDSALLLANVDSALLRVHHTK